MRTRDSLTADPSLLARVFPIDRDHALGGLVPGVAMILAPALLLAGALLRLGVDFFYPAQLAAYQDQPQRMAAAYGLFGLGLVLLFPAVLGLAGRIWRRCPGWALWGGLLTMFGLFARVFHAGVDHLAFQLVEVEGLDAAVRIVGDSYTAGHVFTLFNAAIMLGWIVLAIGALRSGALRPWAAIALAATAALPLGVLKGTTALSLVALTGMSLAFLPLGVHLLRRAGKPRAVVTARWLGLLVVTVAALWLLGGLG